MNNKTIRCCLLGAQEKDLFILGELHKQRDVEIVFVYDKDPGAVGLEIAEILRIPRAYDAAELAAFPDVEYVVVSEPRVGYGTELEQLAAGGTKIITQTEALSVLAQRSATPSTSASAISITKSDDYTLDDALAAFERLFDRQELLKFLLDVAVQAANASAGSIMMYSEEAAELYIAYATGLSERVINRTRQKLGEGIAGTVAKTRQGQVIRQTPENSLYAGDRDRMDIASAISVPLLWDERLLGVLNVSSGSGGLELDEAGLATLERMSPRISRVLNESLKLQETQVRHQELHLRQSMGELTERSISSNAKFSLISNLLSELLHADTVELFLSTQEGDWLVLGGSNRRLSKQPEIVRCDRGALSRAFLEKRTIVLTESSDGSDPDQAISSFVFAPLFLSEMLGVALLEFSAPHRLDEFLVVKDSISLELSRFIASARRERMLQRELDALARVSDSAPIMLTCHSLEELGDFLARLIAEVMECERVSVRLQGLNQGEGKLARFDNEAILSEAWNEEDDERFLRLKKKQEPFTLAFLNFAPEVGTSAQSYHSLTAIPIMIDGEFCGGIIAYDKHPTDTMEDATFSDLDQSILQHVVQMTVPIIRNLSSETPATRSADKPSYDTILQGHGKRLARHMEGEMSRSERYHHSFSLMVLKIQPLAAMFDDDFEQALKLVDEITRGIQTRTRKTDYGSWIRRDTFAMITLEGTKRIKFLVSRLMMYLLKDFSSVGGTAIDPADILVSNSVYPGTAKTPDAMLDEAERNLKPASGE